MTRRLGAGLGLLIAPVLMLVLAALRRSDSGGPGRRGGLRDPGGVDHPVGLTATRRSTAAALELSGLLLEHLVLARRRRNRRIADRGVRGVVLHQLQRQFPRIRSGLRVGAGLAVLSWRCSMNAGISGAFEDAPVAFAVPFLASRLGLMIAPAITSRGRAPGQHDTAYLTWTPVEVVL